MAILATMPYAATPILPALAKIKKLNTITVMPLDISDTNAENPN